MALVFGRQDAHQLADIAIALDHPGRAVGVADTGLAPVYFAKVQRATGRP